MGRVARVLAGFLVAAIAAGAAQVALALGPLELAEAAVARGSELLIIVLLAATQSAVFALLFGMPLIALSEFHPIRAWSFFAGAGVVVSLAGWVVQQVAEGQVATAPSTIANLYAGFTFVMTGLVGGTTYWLVAGRRAESDPRTRQI